MFLLQSYDIFADYSTRWSLHAFELQSAPNDKFVSQ